MSTRSLTTYLNDHLAGSVAGLELLDHLIERHADPWAALLAGLRGEIEEDQTSLRDLLRRLGAAESSTKAALGWVSEKLGVARRTLSPGYEAELATLEELETLALGILGKLKLWRALAIGAGAQPALQGLDFARLEQRAQNQHERVEALRLDAARAALGPVPSDVAESGTKIGPPTA
jgi:hypothetical protein